MNDVTQLLINKESYWLTLTLLHLEARPRPRDCSMFCIEKCKQLGIMVSSKAATLRMLILTFARFRGSCLNTRPTGRVFEHRPCDPASVNAMKQTCVIVILIYFTWFQHKQHWKRRLNIEYPFSYTWFLKTKWRQRQLSNVITSLERHICACNVFANENIMIWKWILQLQTPSLNEFPCKNTS